jgi:hypothetical protein
VRLAGEKKFLGMSIQRSVDRRLVMKTLARAVPLTNTRLWTSRALRGLAVLFLIFDGIMKLVKPEPVMEAFARLGLPQHTSVGIGLLLLTCTALYVVPRTAIVGAVLLTGYLGGAVAIHVRAGDPLFPVVFPILFGALAWGGLALVDARIPALLALRAER